MGSSESSGVGRERRGGRALFAFVLCLLALPAWTWTIDVPWMRASAVATWLLLGLGLFFGASAARTDRRLWVRGLLGLDLAVLAGFAWLFFGVARLPASRATELARAPDFALPSTAGGTVRLSEELARGPVHLVFFRGPW